MYTSYKGCYIRLISSIICRLELLYIKDKFCNKFKLFDELLDFISILFIIKLKYESK